MVIIAGTVEQRHTGRRKIGLKGDAQRIVVSGRPEGARGYIAMCLCENALTDCWGRTAGANKRAIDRYPNASHGNGSGITLGDGNSFSILNALRLTAGGCGVTKTS